MEDFVALLYLFIYYLGLLYVHCGLLSYGGT
jgi:hypothetical protein